MRPVIVFLWCMPLMSQSAGFNELLDKAALRSGVWEAPVDANAAVRVFGQRASAVLLNIRTSIRQAANKPPVIEAYAKLLLRLENAHILPCWGGFVPWNADGVRVIVKAPNNCNLRRDVDVITASDGRTASSIIAGDLESLSLSFVRTLVHETDRKPYEGIWTVSDLDRSVVFRLAFSKGVPMLTQDILLTDSPEESFASLGEVWWCAAEKNGQITAGSDRPAFNGEFTAVSVDGGNGFRLTGCSGRVGLLCPVTLKRVDEQGAQAALRSQFSR